MAHSECVDCIQKNNYKEEKCRKEVVGLVNSVSVYMLMCQRSMRCTNVAMLSIRTRVTRQAP